MHTTDFDSFSLIHDGDYSGTMYLSTEHVCVIVTAKSMEDALRAGTPGAERIDISGPNHEHHDRDEVFEAPEYDTIKAGPWEIACIKVHRADIERALIFKRTTHLIDLLGQYDGADIPFDAAVRGLDEMLVQLASIYPDVTL